MTTPYTIPDESTRQEYQRETVISLAQWLNICDDMIAAAEEANKPYNDTSQVIAHWQAHKNMIQECLANKETPTPCTK